MSFVSCNLLEVLQAMILFLGHSTSLEHNLSPASSVDKHKSLENVVDHYHNFIEIITDGSIPP